MRNGSADSGSSDEPFYAEQKECCANEALFAKVEDVDSKDESD